jgi:hypothetical protein
MDPADVQGTEVALAVAGGPYAVLEPMVPPETLQHSIPDLSPGDYKCRLVSIDLLDARGEPPVELPFNIVDESPPGPVENASITVS